MDFIASAETFGLFRQDRPRKRKRVIPIRKVGANDQLQCVILASQCYGVLTHWTGKQTKPHRAEKTLCEWCEAKCPTKWTGFLHVLVRDERQSCYVELTDFAHERLEKACGDRKDWRGLKVTFSRERKTVKAPVWVTFQGEVGPAEMKTLPAYVDPIETLSRLWKFNLAA